MKRIHRSAFNLLALLCMPALLTISACKRGEDDPFLSLKTRDGRIIGEWIVQSIESKDEINSTTNSNVVNTTVEVKYTAEGDFVRDTMIVTNNSNYKRTYTIKSPTISVNIMENGILEGIEESGDVSITGTNITGAITNTQSLKNTIKGYWEWGTSDKSKTSITLGTGRTGLVFSGGARSYRVQQLKSKEVVLILDEYSKSDENTPGVIISDEWKSYTKMVLTPKE
jgi:hypothetical protein